MPLKPFNVTDLQFLDKYEGEKLRRLMDEFRRIASSINLLIREVSGETDDAATQHVIATTIGLGPQHTTSGLSAKMFLGSISADDAAFQLLQLDDLSDVTTGGAIAGQFLVKTPAGYGFASLPNLSALADPNANKLVWWNDASNQLEFLGIGDGLGITAGNLVVDESELDHGSLSGLGDDDHPQYTQWAQHESVTMLWEFREGIDVVDTSLPIALQRYHIDVETDFVIRLVDEFGVETDLLRSSRIDGQLIDTITIGNESQVAPIQLLGSLFLPLDDVAVTLGVGGDLALYRGEDYAELTNLTGVLYVTSDDGIRAQTDLLEVFAPDVVQVDGEAYTHAGRWTRTLNFGMAQWGVFNDDYGGEVFMQVDVNDDVIEQVNFSASLFTWNGETLATVSGAGVYVGSFTFASLPSSAPAGSIAFVSNALKVAEVPGSGTGTLAYYDGTAWRRVGDDATVSV